MKHTYPTTVRQEATAYAIAEAEPRNIAPTSAPHRDPGSATDDESAGDTGERIIPIFESISAETTYRVVRQLLAMEASSPGEPIHMHIYSPGGCVISGLGIIDAMQHISSPVFTYAVGYAASMAAVILACGEKDHRYILPHSRVMIHQASGSAGGSLDNLRATLAFQTELEVDADVLLAEATGRTIEEIRDASRVDNWMKSHKAAEFGLVDHVLEPFVAPKGIHI